ncbi:MAG: hypothetical protein ABI843_00660 [Dokdonella sp.]
MRDATSSTLAHAATRWLPWLLALAGFAFDVAAYWPGQMSFDSAYTWWQVRNGTTMGIVPPVFVLVWRACDAILAGPGLLFALHLTLFWGGLALLVRSLRFGVTSTLLTILVIGFAPVPLLLRGHVWTDVGLFSALLSVTAALASAHSGHRRGWLLLALPLLLYAATLRHNALGAVLPFALWFGWLSVRAGDAAKRSSAMLASVGLLAAILLLTQALDATVRERAPSWPMLAQWDLAALSIETDRMLLPDFMIGPGLDVPDLAQAFRPWSNLPMLMNTKHGMRAPFETFSDEDLALLRRAWLDAIAAYPRAWLAHRWRLTRALLGAHAPDWPSELLYVDDEVVYRDNPSIARNATALHAALMDSAATLAATPLLAPWPYLLTGLLSLPAAWHRRRLIAGKIALVLLASTALYALTFTLFATSAELRYLGWPCIASLLAAACAWMTPREATR